MKCCWVLQIHVSLSIDVFRVISKKKKKIPQEISLFSGQSWPENGQLLPEKDDFFYRDVELCKCH